ncbi:equilibrative nucleoside transporter 3-like [Bolinopsis microptera]|uniref:equilibrative nucleoside transporter 3-like n=1 Tax=Bolinopsis microptera TaxID=2820187 RepID=UPI00307924C3
MTEIQLYINPRTKWTVYFFMVLFGLSSLLPWNMVITATGYFAAKFSETNSTQIETGFPSYFQIGGIGSNVVFSLSSIVLLKYVPIKPVLITCNIVALIIFVVMTVMSKQITVTWPMSFFYISNVIFCVACAVSAAYISGMMAVASMLTPTAVQGFFLGQGAAGLFATLLSIITLSIPGADPVQAGFYYFLIAAISLALSLVAYLLFSRMSYVRYNTMRKEEKIEDQAGAGADLSACQVFMNIWKFCISSLITLSITLACFPAALSALRSTSTDTTSRWTTTYFSPVMIFLIFNIGDVLGRVTSSLLPYPTKRLILPISVCRIVFIPLLYMCNLQPRSLTVWFKSDLWPAIFNLLMSWTNGHLLSLSAVYGPQEVETKSAQSLAGTYRAFSGTLGLVIGSILVFPFLYILKN